MKLSLLLVVLLALLAPTLCRAAQPAMQVEYWAGNQPKGLRPLKSLAPDAGAEAMDALPLVLKEPARVRAGGSVFELDQEGLYRFRDRGTSRVVRQVLLYRGDVWRLAGHLSRLYVYGRRHQADDPARLTERARTGEAFSVQCGTIAGFVVHHLTAQGIPARMVQCVTGSNWNHFDDGHVLMELRDPAEKRWVLYDATLGTRYRHRGRLLDLLQVTELYRAGGRPEVEFLNAASKLDPQESYERIYGPYLPGEAALAAFLGPFRRLLDNDTAALHRWYARMMQIPLIGNTFVPASDAEDALMRTLDAWKGLERLTPAQFRQRHYPPEPAGG